MSLINYKRLDLVVKYLFAKDIIANHKNEAIRSLYIRHILMRTGGVEPPSVEKISSIKNCIDDYINQFEDLIYSLQKMGFDKNFPVLLTNDGLLTNGAHRLAACEALGINPIIKRVENGGLWDFDWFCSKGFNTEDKQRILKGFIDINPNECAIFVIWNPLFKYIDNVKTIIKNYFNIVGEVELDFENNYIAFTNAILDIYEPNISINGDDTTIREKAKLLQTYYLSFKVIVVTNQNKSDKSIADLSKLCKKDIREFFDHLIPKECFCTVHSSDCEEETKYLAAVLLSPNNIKHLKMRLSQNGREAFGLYCKELKEVCKKENILLNDICVVGGSPLEVIGIKNVQDIDFVTKYEYRHKYGDNPVKLTDNIDMASKQYHRNNTENIIYDDILINNSEYHFIYKGIKFANLRIIKDRKIFSHRDKDVLDLRQIELFENYYGHIEQEKIFKARIIQEQKRRGLISEEFSTPSISINISQKTNINKKKLPRWLGKIICLFIPKAKNRKRFREKYVMKRS